MTAPNHIVGGFTFTGIFAATGDDRPISLEASTTVLEGRERRKSAGKLLHLQIYIL